MIEWLVDGEKGKEDVSIKTLLDESKERLEKAKTNSVWGIEEKDKES